MHLEYYLGHTIKHYKKRFSFIFNVVIRLALRGMKHFFYLSILCKLDPFLSAYISRATKKNNSDQAYSCLRD